MNEASKTNRVRGPAFIAAYLEGRVIDIGCGEDLVVPWAEPFDRVHGDASRISQLRPQAAYDCVHSSHCLEHQEHPHDALAQWWALVRPGGHMITVVPDEELYEQGLWPSAFNPDHKWAFTMDPSRAAPHVIDVVAMHRRLRGAELVEISRHDHGYRREILVASRRKIDLRKHRMRRHVIAWLYKLRIGRLRPELRLWPLLARLGVPIDQTEGHALAQLQIVVRKSA
jgi:SAM-dependent methyltransferase